MKNFNKEAQGSKRNRNNLFLAIFYVFKLKIQKHNLEFQARPGLRAKFLKLSNY